MDTIITNTPQQHPVTPVCLTSGQTGEKKQKNTMFTAVVEVVILIYNFWEQVLLRDGVNVIF